MIITGVPFPLPSGTLESRQTTSSGTAIAGISIPAFAGGGCQGLIVPYVNGGGTASAAVRFASSAGMSGWEAYYDTASSSVQGSPVNTWVSCSAGLDWYVSRSSLGATSGDGVLSLRLNNTLILSINPQTVNLFALFS